MGCCVTTMKRNMPKIKGVDPIDFLEHNSVLPFQVGKKLSVFYAMLGIKLGDPVENIKNGNGNLLLQFVEFPNGWSREETPNSQGVMIFDCKNRARFVMSPYVSFLGVEGISFDIYPRYTCSTRGSGIEEAKNNKQGVSGVVIDYAYSRDEFNGEKIIYKTKFFYPSKKRPTFGDAEQVALDQCEAWLNKHYPDWENPTAYWKD